MEILPLHLQRGLQSAASLFKDVFGKFGAADFDFCFIENETRRFPLLLLQASIKYFMVPEASSSLSSFPVFRFTNLATG